MPNRASDSHYPDTASLSRRMEDPLRYLRVSSIQSYSAGEVIFTPADPANQIFVVIAGAVRLMKVAETGREVLIRVHHTDDVFGESAFVHSDRGMKAIAMEETQLMAWSVEQIQRIGAESPQLFFSLLQMSAARSHELEERFRGYAVENVGQRLAHALLEFSKVSAARNGSDSMPAKMTTLTHEMIASYIGTSREVVTHLMNKWRRMGYIDYSRKGTNVYRDLVQGIILNEQNFAAEATYSTEAKFLAAGQSVM